MQQDAAKLLAEARVEGEAIVTRSRAAAERLGEELRQKASAEAAGILKNAEREIQLETTRAIEQVRREAVELSVAIASKILHRDGVEGGQPRADRRHDHADRHDQALTAFAGRPEFEVVLVSDAVSGFSPRFVLMIPSRPPCRRWTACSS